jgi:hypothetical protein
MNEGLSHYVNSSGNNWDTLVPFYLMAYRSTPHSTSGYSPYFLLHGREMEIPTAQNLKAKLSPEVRNHENANRLENLKFSLKRAHQEVRKNSRKSHQVNKKYYDRKAKIRTFELNEIVYLFTPAIKRGQCKKFRKFWSGPYKATEKLSELNYRIESQQGKEYVVHVNRLKRAYNQDVWKPNSRKNRGVKRSARKSKEEREAGSEDEDTNILPPREIVVTPQLEDSQTDLDMQDLQQTVGTYAGAESPVDDPNSAPDDSIYMPPDTPRSRRELGTTRLDPPITRLRASLQAQAEEEGARLQAGNMG